MKHNGLAVHPCYHAACSITVQSMLQRATHREVATKALKKWALPCVYILRTGKGIEVMYREGKDEIATYDGSMVRLADVQGSSSGSCRHVVLADTSF